MVTIDDLDLIQIQAEALFVHDARGQLLHVNDLGHRSAPRFFLGHTASGRIYRLRSDVPREIGNELTQIGQALVAEARESSRGVEALVEHPENARLNPRLPGNRDDARPVNGLPRPTFEAFIAEAFGSLERYEQVKAILERHAPVRPGHVGPAYHFPDQNVEVPLASEAIALGPNDGLLLDPAIRDWAPELGARQPCLALVRDGRAVAICACSRRTSRAAEAGIETAPSYRHQGYGAAVVSAWGAAVRDMGLLPLYSTSWDNVASQGIARRLGLVQYGIDVSVD
jgi:hypothetical protein